MNKRNHYILLDYFEVFVLVLLTIGPIPSLYKVIVYAFIFIINIFRGTINLNTGISRNNMVIPGLLISSILVAMVIDIGNIGLGVPYSLSNFAYLIPFVFCLFYIKRFDLEYFLWLLEKVAFFLCICSLIGFSIQRFDQNIIYRLPSIFFYERRVYFSLFYNAILGWDGLLMRNCGCAFEPGAFQFLLNLGLAIFLKQNKNTGFVKMFIRLLFYALAIITTVSTTGLLIFVCVVLLSCLKCKRYFFVCGVLFMMLYPFFLYTINGQIMKMENDNFESRFGNTFYVLNNYWQCFFGVGSTGYYNIYAANKNIGSWDLFSNLFLRFGYPFIFLFLLNVIKVRKISWPIFVVIFLSFFTESLIGPVSLLIMFYPCSNTFASSNKCYCNNCFTGDNFRNNILYEKNSVH